MAEPRSGPRCLWLCRCLRGTFAPAGSGVVTLFRLVPLFFLLSLVARAHPAWGADVQPVAPTPDPAAAPGSGDPPPGSPTGSVSQTGSGRGRIAVAPRLALRVGHADKTVFPTGGIGLGGTLEFDYFRTAGGWEAALGIDFGFDRFRGDDHRMIAVRDEPHVVVTSRVLSETTFLLVHTGAIQLGLVRPYLTVGGGIGLGYFDSLDPTLQPGTDRQTHLLGRVSLGLDIAVWSPLLATIRADYTAVHGISSFQIDQGRTVILFGDVVDLGVGIAYRF